MMTNFGIFLIGLLEYDAGYWYKEITVLLAFIGFSGIGICAAIIIIMNDYKPRWKK